MWTMLDLLFLPVAECICSSALSFLMFRASVNHLPSLLMYDYTFGSGASIPPETMMHFPPCFRFPPYFRKIFGLSENCLQFYLFPTNFLTFIRQNYLFPTNFLTFIRQNF